MLLVLIYRGISPKEVSNLSIENVEPPKIEKETPIDNPSSIEKTRKVVSNTDRLNRLPKYEEEGLECKAINGPLERGDCFQKVNEDYLILQVRETKQVFYFPASREQDDWKNVFHLPIGENDYLGELIKEEHYDDYIDELSTTGTNDQRGLERVQDFWYVFSKLIPSEYRPNLKRIYWTDTGPMEAYGFGWEEKDLQEHYLMLSHNAAEYHGLLKNTIIHEFAHLLTLTGDQVDIYDETEPAIWKKGTGDCPTYSTRKLCVKKDSYLYPFYQQFWADIEDEWMAIKWDSETEYKEFFYLYEDRFFNSYQGTSPLEDIADTFTFFVITNSTEAKEQQGTKYEKLLYFYQFDKLVQLRTAILENMYDLSMKDRELY